MEKDLLYLEKKTTQSLHDRFSEVLLDQLTQRKVLFKGNKKSMVLWLQNIPRSQLSEGAPQKGSVWTRIGWKSSWKRGVWNFRNKYKCGTRFSPSTRGRASSSRLVLVPKSGFSLIQKRGALRGVLRRRRRRRRRLLRQASPFKGKSVKSRLGVASKPCGLPGAATPTQKKVVPSKKQLDADLDQYMSNTKSHLDEQLDQYMSLSRSRLDAQLDEYMAMAGEGAVTPGEGAVTPGEGAVWQ